jgi:uncharacterized protein
MNSRLVTLLLRHKVKFQQGIDKPLIHQIREAAYKLEGFRIDRGEGSGEVHVILDGDLEMLCVVAVSSLGKSEILGLLNESDPAQLWRPPRRILERFEGKDVMLAAAAGVGDISTLKKLLIEGAEANSDGGLLGHALQAAAVGGHEAAAKLLVDSGANVEKVYSMASGTALCLAARFGHNAVVQALLEKGAKLTFDPKDRQALHHAMGNGGHESVILDLLHHGANVNGTTISGETALHYAARIGVRESVITLLLERGADIESTNSAGETPLFVAAIHKRSDMVKLLLAKGANIQVQNSHHKSILHLIVPDKSQTPMLQLLLHHAIDPNTPDQTGETALHLAVTTRDIPTITTLLSAGANIHAATKTGHGPLHKCLNRHPTTAALPLAHLLLDNGADASARTTTGLTPLHLSASKGHAALTSLLLASGAAINAATTTGKTALHSAAEYGSAEIVRLLLDAGADVNAQTVEGVAVLHVVVLGNHLETVWLLLEHGADVHVPAAAPGSDCAMLEALVAAGGELEAKMGWGRRCFFQAVAGGEGGEDGVAFGEGGRGWGERCGACVGGDGVGRQ